MSKITILDAATGEVIEREPTQDELLAHDEIASQVALVNEEIHAQNEARLSALAKLAALGLTEEEIAAL